MLDSVWLRHPRIWWTLGGLILLASVATWVFNREVPTLIGVQYMVPTVEAGKPLVMIVPAHRNLDRKCAVDISRTFVNSEHARQVVTSMQHVSAEGLEAREKETPGQLIVTVNVPANAPPGPSQFDTENQYRCPFNPSTWFWKIEDRWTYNLNVIAKGASQ
jgi:hypothetical protein